MPLALGEMELSFSFHTLKFLLQVHFHFESSLSWKMLIHLFRHNRVNHAKLIPVLN